MHEAPRDWQLKRQLRQENLKWLPELWDEGLASEPAKPLDFDDLRRMARSIQTPYRKPLRMAANLFWRPRACEDLFNIYELIPIDDQAAAERLGERKLLYAPVAHRLMVDCVQI